FGFLQGVFAAAVGAQQFEIVEREHVGVDVDNGHGHFLGIFWSFSGETLVVEGRGFGAQQSSLCSPDWTRERGNSMPISFDLVGPPWQRKILVVAAITVGVVLLMTMRPIYPDGAYWHEAVERSGAILILIGVLGRTWCSMYIGGNKLTRLVTDGPY